MRDFDRMWPDKPLGASESSPAPHESAERSPKRSQLKPCRHCKKTFAQHGRFGRCSGGQTQYEAAESPVSPTTHGLKKGDRIRIRPDGNRHHSYCDYHGVGTVEKLTYSRVTVRFRGSELLCFKPESLIVDEASMRSHVLPEPSNQSPQAIQP